MERTRNWSRQKHLPQRDNPMKMATLWLAVFYCLLHGYNTVPAAAQNTTLPKFTTIHFKLGEEQVPVLSVNLDGKKVGTFVLDTSTSLSFLAPVVASKLGLERKPAMGDDGIPLTIRGKQTEDVLIPNCKIGDLTFNLKFILWDEASNWKIGGHPIDGIIGANFFYYIPVLLNYQRLEMTLWRPDSFGTTSLKPFGITQNMMLPLVRLDNDLLFATPVVFNKTAKENLVISLGSNLTRISKQLALKLKLIPEKDSEERFFDNIGSSYFPVILTHVPTLSLGKQTLSNVRVGYSEKENAGNQPTLGTDVLTKFLVLIDFPDKRIYLKPVSRNKNKRK